MKRLICAAHQDEDGDVIVEALGSAWAGLVSHGATLQEAFTNFGEAATLYLEEVEREDPT